MTQLSGPHRGASHDSSRSVLASWATNLDGSGTAPGSFTGNNQVFNIQNGQSATLGGAWTVTGTGSSVLIQAGGQFSTGANNPTFTRLTIQSGALYVVGNSTYGGIGAFTLDAGSTLRLDNQANPRAGAGVTYGNLVFNGTNSGTFGAGVTVAGTLQVSGSGTPNLTGTANVTHAVGNLTVDAARALVLSSGTGNVVVNLTGNLTNNGTISKPGGTSGTAAVNFTGTGSSTARWGTIGTLAGGLVSVTVDPGRTVTFTDTLTTGAALSLTNNGTLNFGNGGTAGGVGGDFANAGTVNFNRSNAVNYGGVISGAGSVAQIGGGTTTLSGANTYTGATAVTGGTLALASSGSITNSSGIAVSSGATYDVSGVSGYALGSATNQTLSGTGSVVGAVTVASGSSIRGDTGTGTGALTTDAVTVNSGGKIAANIAGTGTSSSLALGADALDLKTGSILKLTSVTGFNADQAGTYTIASLTGSLKLDGSTKANGFVFGEYTFGPGASGPVVIDPTLVSGLDTGDYFSLTVSGGNLQLNFSPAPVPEPAAVLGIEAAARGVGGVVRRRWKTPSDPTKSA